MAKKSKSLKFIMVLVIIVGILGGAFYFALPVQQTTYIYTGDLGVITQKVTVYNWWNSWTKVFQQAIIFGQENAKIGDVVTLHDEFDLNAAAHPLTASECYFGTRDLLLHTPSGDVQLDFGFYEPALSNMIGSAVVFDLEFTATEIGTYSGLSHYGEAQCAAGGVSCGTSLICDQIWEEDSTNSVVVTSGTVPPEPCELEASWYAWNFYSDITNGIINVRTHYNVNDNCEFYKDNTEYRTICSNGYQITGTDGSSTGTGQLTCEVIPAIDECAIDDDCTNSAKPICTNTNCVLAECSETENIALQCADNSSIIIKNCVNNRLVDTENTCPIVNTTDVCDTLHLNLCLSEAPCETNNGYWYDDKCNSLADTTNTTTNTTTDTNTSINTTISPTTTTTSPTEDVNYLIIGSIIGGGILFVLIILYFANKKSKRKRK